MSPREVAAAPTGLGRRVLAQLGVAVCVLALGVAAATSAVGAVLSVAVAGAVLVFCLPVWLLPSVALVIFAVLPVGYLTAVPQYLGRFFTPSLLVMVIWLFRSHRSRQPGAGRSALSRFAAPLVVLLLVLARLSVNPVRSLLWVTVFVAVCLWPVVRAARADPRTSTALVRTWLGVGAGLSLLAVLESIARVNPLAPYFSIDQHWSVYRVTTLLGHPLMNGTFFAMTACLALFTALRHDSPQTTAVATFVLTSTAAALSGSRSGVYALVFGLASGLVVLLWSRRIAIAPKIAGIALALVAVVVIPNLPVFAARVGSAEAAASTIYRSGLLRLTRQLFLQHPLLGGGPGTSANLADRAGASLPLESAVLGSLVSLGVVGCLGLVGFLLLLATRLVRLGRLESLAALVAFLVAGAAFPLWETNPSTWVLVGLVALVGADPPSGAPAAPGAPRRITTDTLLRARREHVAA